MKKLVLLLILGISMLYVSAQEKEYKDELYESGHIESLVDSVHQACTAGDFMIQSGRLQLAGVGLTIAGAAVMLSGDSNENDYETRIVAGSVMGLAGFVCSIVGHAKLIKAGKILNEDYSISFVPTKEGLGLALRF